MKSLFEKLEKIKCHNETDGVIIQEKIHGYYSKEPLYCNDRNIRRALDEENVRFKFKKIEALKYYRVDDEIYFSCSLIGAKFEMMESLK